jgi:hypothetical protein
MFLHPLLLLYMLFMHSLIVSFNSLYSLFFSVPFTYSVSHSVHVTLDPASFLLQFFDQQSPLAISFETFTIPDNYHAELSTSESHIDSAIIIAETETLSSNSRKYHYLFLLSLELVNNTDFGF